MEIDSCFNYLSDNESRNILGKPLSFLYMLVKIVAIDILCYDVDMSFTSDSLLIFDYLWMRYYFHDFTLIIKSGYGNACKFFSTYILKGK